MPYGLSHDLKAVRNRETGPLVRKIVLQRHRFDEVDDGSADNDDIAEKIAIITRCRHSVIASARIRAPMYGFSAAVDTKSTFSPDISESCSSRARNEDSGI